jgi:hypothetical protein
MPESIIGNRGGHCTKGVSYPKYLNPFPFVKDSAAYIYATESWVLAGPYFDILYNIRKKPEIDNSIRKGIAMPIIFRFILFSVLLSDINITYNILRPFSLLNNTIMQIS